MAEYDGEHVHPPSSMCGRRLGEHVSGVECVSAVDGGGECGIALESLRVR
jgi:hypothetical protein